MKRVLIVGATSAIAAATARRFAATGDALYLVARNADRLAETADDLRARGATRVESFALDMDEIERHGEMLAAATNALGGLDMALVAYGTLPDQAETEASVEATLREWHTNATSTIALLTLLASDFERRGAGVIAVITSVAGDRGRKTNYTYGAAKAAVTTFCGGLRGRLAARGVRVVTIKPGFVDTPMTAHLPKGPLFASAEKVGGDIHAAMTGKGEVIYTPFFWRYVMLGIRAVPERVFKRLSV